MSDGSDFSTIYDYGAPENANRVRWRSSELIHFLGEGEEVTTILALSDVVVNAAGSDDDVAGANTRPDTSSHPIRSRDRETSTNRTIRASSE